MVDTASVAQGYGDWSDDTGEVAWHDDATDTWQRVDDSDPTEVMAPYAQPQYLGPQGAYDPGFAPGYGQQPYPQAGVPAQQMTAGGTPTRRWGWAPVRRRGPRPP